MSFSKIGATCLAKICATKVQEGIVEIEKVEQDIPIDKSVEENLKKIKSTSKKVKKSLIRLNNTENKQYSVNIDEKNPINEVLKLTPFSELEYII